MHSKLWLISMSLVAACSSGAIDKGSTPVVIVNNGVADMGSTSDTSTSDGGSGIDLGGPTTEPDGPMVLDLSVNPPRITEGGTATVNALLSDPQGFADIGGGRLLDRQNNVVGLFQGSGGSYTFAVTWEAIDAVDPISFATGETRLFTAEFFDAADHRATQRVAIELHCDGGPACEGACGLIDCAGTCSDASQFVDDPANCGMCGHSCPSGICVDSACSDCQPLAESIGPCDPLCQTGCGANEGCYVGNPDGIMSTCAPVGTQMVGQPCDASPQNCAAGLVCANAPSNPDTPTCVQFCRLGGSDPGCGTGMCMQISPNTEIGVCFVAAP